MTTTVVGKATPQAHLELPGLPYLQKVARLIPTDPFLV